MASSSFTSSSNSSLVSIVKALSCLLFLSFSSVFLGVTADTLSKNVSSSAARKRDASSSSSSSAAARKREEDARVVDQLAANLMMNAGARMQNEKTPRNNGTFASSTRDANTGDTLDANNYASSPVRTRPDVDAAFLYRISGEMVSKMRARMPRELVERGDPVAEARYASARCEDSSGGIALNFIFDFFDALLDAAGFRAYDDQTNRMYQMHSRSNRSDGDSIVSTTREANAITENDDDENEAIPMINIEDAFYTRAKSFYLANKDEKENEERIHRALGKFEEGDAFAACPSEINAWTWLFSFFQLDLSSFGGGIGGVGLHFCPGPLQNALCFFISGFPGGVDYAMLALVKDKVMHPYTEKIVNGAMNAWVRGPGLTMVGFCMYLGAKYGRTRMPTWAAAFCGLLSWFNGNYYSARVVASAGSVASWRPS